MVMLFERFTLTTTDSVYSSNDFIAYAKSIGCILTHAPPYMHESNGLAERYWRTLINTAHTMLLTAKLPPIFWEVAVLHACYLINRTPHSGIKNELPYTRWYDKKPDLSHLRIFGAPVYVHITTDYAQGIMASH